MGQAGGPLVVLDHVDKHFGDLHVLRDIDLSVDRGEVVVVIGPSGSGKSTLCRAINRLEPIDGGTITLDGRPLPAEGKRAGPPARRRRHGVPVVQPVRPHDGAAERHRSARSRCARCAEARRRAQARGAARARRHRRAGRQVPGAAVRRPAAAGGDRPRAGDGAEGDAVRRADVGARPGDGQRGARRDDRPGPGRHDDGRRHPRDGLRPQGGQPGRLHGRRPDRRDRRPRDASSPTRRPSGPRTSSPRSSCTDRPRPAPSTRSPTHRH